MRKIKKPLLMRLAFVGLIASILLGALILLEKTGQTSFFETPSSARPETDSKAKTTSKAPTAQSNYNNGDEREAGNSSRENEGTGGISDTQGNIPTSLNQNQPAKSSSGEITVYSPARNSTLKSGQVLAGASTLSKINYRIIDDVSGMLDMGELSVVNGKFSGTINFQTPSASGRIDIFATRPDGSEFSSVELSVRFK